MPYVLYIAPGRYPKSASRDFKSWDSVESGPKTEDTSSCRNNHPHYKSYSWLDVFVLDLLSVNQPSNQLKANAFYSQVAPEARQFLEDTTMSCRASHSCVQSRDLTQQSAAATIPREIFCCMNVPTASAWFILVRRAPLQPCMKRRIYDQKG